MSVHPVHLPRLIFCCLNCREWNSVHFCGMFVQIMTEEAWTSGVGESGTDGRRGRKGEEKRIAILLTLSIDEALVELRKKLLEVTL